jgi:hypothetical protein
LLNQSILSKIFFFLLLSVVSSATQLKAQDTFQEIYYDYLRGETTRLQTIETMVHYLEHDHHEHDIIKCLTPLIILMENEQQETNTSNPLSLKTAPNKTEFFTSEFISPSGKFRINYVTSGQHKVPLDDLNGNAIPDYVEEVAEAADYSYNHEIITLGFTDPIPERVVYDIFVRDMQYYGLTNNRTSDTFPCNNLASGTCIYIENDFVDFPDNDDPEGQQIGAIKVTMAHEFKHAIQFAQNNWQGDSDRWAEMDATLMEEVVYDDVNDYYNYIKGSSDLFSSPSTTLSAGSYEDVTWALYFHEYFGQKFWPDVWDIIESNNQIPLIRAIETELQSRSESYHAAVLESYMWHFASGSNFARNNYGFDEAFEYPEPSITETITELQQELTDTLSLNAFAARYYLVDLSELRYPPSGYVKLNFDNVSSDIHIGLLGYLKNGSIKTQTALETATDSRGSIKTSWAWEDIQKVGMVVMNSDTNKGGTYSYQFTEYFPEQIQLAQNFPNPFNPQTTIQVANPVNQVVTLNIYDILGRFIQTVYEGTLEAGFKNFVVDGSSLASGIYVYRLESKNSVKTKMMTLIK